MNRSCFASIVPVCLVASFALAAGCSKEKESLLGIGVQLAMEDARATDLTGVTLSAKGGPQQAIVASQTFALPSPLSTTPMVFGLYVPGSATGNVTVQAAATPTTDCLGFRGEKTATITEAGRTVVVTIELSAVDTCTPGDGGAGSGGTGGAGGSSGGSGGGVAGASGRGGSAGGVAGSGGGAAGAGGRGGSAGSAAGAGGRGGGGGGGRGGGAGYPSLMTCTMYDHNATSGTCTERNGVDGVAISGDGTLVATGSGDDHRVKIWRFDGRTLMPADKEFSGFTGGVYSPGVAFSPDGTRLAMIAGLMVRTYVVNGWTAGPTLSDASGNGMVGVEFTPDSRRIVTATQIGFAGGDAYVYAADGNGLPTGTVHLDNEPATLGVSPRAAANGSVAVVVGSWYATAQVTMLGASGFSTPVPLAAHGTGTMGHSTFSPDGALLAAAEHGGWVRLWDIPATASSTPNGADIRFAAGGYVAVFSPAGTHLAIAGGTVLSIYDLTTRVEAARANPAPAYDVNTVAFAPNGAIIAGLDDCGKVLVCTP